MHFSISAHHRSKYLVGYFVRLCVWVIVRHYKGILAMGCLGHMADIKYADLVDRLRAFQHIAHPREHVIAGGIQICPNESIIIVNHQHNISRIIPTPIYQKFRGLLCDLTRVFEHGDRLDRRIYIRAPNY